MLEYLPVRPDVLVFVLALLLYVTDFGRLIYSNEVLLCSSGSGRWGVLTPDDGFLFSRRFAVFPRPFDPGSLVIAMTWPTEKDVAKGEALRERIAAKQPELAYPSFACRLLLPQLFLGLPAAYLLPRHDIPVLLMLLVIYVQILALTVWLFRARRRLELPMGKCLLWVFESLVCIPYAANFHRKVGAHLLKGAGQDVLVTASELLPPPARERLAEYLRTAIHDQRPPGDADTARAAALQDLEMRLEEAHASGCP